MPSSDPEGKHISMLYQWKRVRWARLGRARLVCYFATGTVARLITVGGSLAGRVVLVGAGAVSGANLP